MQSYEETYRHFDSPRARQIRREDYQGEIAQHFRVTAAKSGESLPLPRLTAASLLLDAACGPCGPLSHMACRVRARPVSDAEIARRAIHGNTQFVPHGYNEQSLERVGFQLIERRDRTAGLAGRGAPVRRFCAVECRAA